MSCPDWRRLDPAARDGARSAGSRSALRPLHALRRLDAARWEEALRHFDSGCQSCRQEALAVDPTLAFRRLPAPELTPAEEAREVEAARLAVAAMRAASRLEHGGRRERPAVGALLRSRRSRRLPPALGAMDAIRSLHSLPLTRWALAAGLAAMALVSLLFGAGHGWHGQAGVSAGGAALAPRPALSARAAGAPAGSWSPAPQALPVLPAASRGSIEGLSRPEARVYQIDGPHMSVVMIVDDKLDV
jgi:hypothetical protein